LSQRLAQDYRDKKLMRGLLKGLLIANEIFNTVYSEERILEIHIENTLKKGLKSLKLYTKAMKNKVLP
jgi:hypothetical protein